MDRTSNYLFKGVVLMVETATQGITDARAHAARIVEQAGKERNIGRGMCRVNEADRVSIQSGQCPWCHEADATNDLNHLGRNGGEIECPVFAILVEGGHMSRPRVHRREKACC